MNGGCGLRGARFRSSSGSRWFGLRGSFWTSATTRFPFGAGYLNSRASAHARARVLTYDHIQLWLTIFVWIFRWIVVPAKVIPYALASAQWGGRLPWRKVLRMLLNWRWWLAAMIAALVGVLLPSNFFHGEPHGAVAHQVWAVILKVAGAYLLAVASWVLLLTWAAVVLDRGELGKAQPGDDALRVVPVGSGPLDKDSVKLPLPESGNDAVGNT